MLHEMTNDTVMSDKTTCSFSRRSCDVLTVFISHVMKRSKGIPPLLQMLVAFLKLFLLQF